MSRAIASAPSNASINASRMRSARARRWATPRRPNMIAPRRGAGTACCASRKIRSTRRSDAARANGEINRRGKPVSINCAQLRARRRAVGLAEDAAGWTVSFGPVALGVIVDGGDRLRKPKPAGLLLPAGRRFVSGER